jgi:hypothetical protein
MYKKKTIHDRSIVIHKVYCFCIFVVNYKKKIQRLKEILTYVKFNTDETQNNGEQKMYVYF